MRDRERPRLLAHAERRLPRPQAGEFTAGSRRAFEDYRLWFCEKTDRQVKNDLSTCNGHGSRTIAFVVVVVVSSTYFLSHITAFGILLLARCFYFVPHCQNKNAAMP